MDLKLSVVSFHPGQIVAALVMVTVVLLAPVCTGGLCKPQPEICVFFAPRWKSFQPFLALALYSITQLAELKQEVLV